MGLVDLSRIDMILDADGVAQVIDINIAPGMTETSLFPQAVEASGVDLGELYETICADALRQAPLALRPRRARDALNARRDAASSSPGRRPTWPKPGSLGLMIWTMRLRSSTVANSIVILPLARAQLNLRPGCRGGRPAARRGRPGPLCGPLGARNPSWAS